MKIVIDINDKVYGLLRYFEKGLGFNDKKDNSDDVKTALMRAVINGTPLPKLDKPHIRGDYYDGFKNGLRTAEWRYDKIRAEIEEHAKINQNLNTDRARALCWCLDVIDKYNIESEK